MKSVKANVLTDFHATISMNLVPTNVKTIAGSRLVEI